jgi:hypothetical protein
MNIYAQIDTVRFDQTLSLYVTLDQNKGLIDVCELCNQPNKQAILYLKSYGFNHLIFGAKYTNKLSVQGDEQAIVDKNNEKYLTCYYVVAYNIEQNKMYRLKGFRENDFKAFYIYEIPNSLKIKNKPLGKLIDENELNIEYSIEDVDLQCLYEATIKNKGKEQSKCIQSCESRDEKYTIFK